MESVVLTDTLDKGSADNCISVDMAANVNIDEVSSLRYLANKTGNVKPCLIEKSTISTRSRLIRALHSHSKAVHYSITINILWNVITFALGIFLMTINNGDKNECIHPSNYTDSNAHTTLNVLATMILCISFISAFIGYNYFHYKNRGPCVTTIYTVLSFVILVCIIWLFVLFVWKNNTSNNGSITFGDFKCAEVLQSIMCIVVLIILPLFIIIISCIYYKYRNEHCECKHQKRLKRRRRNSWDLDCDCNCTQWTSDCSRCCCNMTAIIGCVGAIAGVIYLCVECVCIGCVCTCGGCNGCGGCCGCCDDCCGGCCNCCDGGCNCCECGNNGDGGGCCDRCCGGCC